MDPSPKFWTAPKSECIIFGTATATTDTVPFSTSFGLVGTHRVNGEVFLECVLVRRGFQRGEIRVLGQHLSSGASVSELAVGYMPSALTLDLGLCAQETLQYFGQLYGMSDSLILSEFNTSLFVLPLPRNAAFYSSVYFYHQGC